MPEKVVLNVCFLSALCDVAVLADQLVNLVLEGKTNAKVMRDLIEELDRVETHQCGDMAEMSQNLLECEFDRVEVTPDSHRESGATIILFEKEKACQATK